VTRFDLTLVERAARRKLSRDPFPGADRAGMPADLAGAETAARRAFSPRRNTWSDVRQFDEQVAELHQKQTAITARLAELNQERTAAPTADADRLAEWQLAGQKGPRPEPELEPIERLIEEAQADFAGLTRAIEHVLAEKAAHIDRHRRRLVREADRHVHEKHDQLLKLMTP
jgi:DNA repair exonuclease SbcCD ATPase subunit